MKPGRELDALIAEKVLNWSRRNDPELGMGWRDDKNSTFYPDKHDSLPAFSEEIAAVWEVVEKLSKKFEFTIENELFDPLVLTSKMWWFVSLREHYTTRIVVDRVEAETAPHAICLAALKAVEEK